jgi:hypothetical protein
MDRRSREEFARGEAVQAPVFLSEGPWVLPPTRVLDVEVDGRSYDVEVTYTAETGAVLHEVTVRGDPPGSGLTDRDLAVPLRSLTLEAVAKAAHAALGQAADGSYRWSESDYQHVAEALRETMRRQQRTSWTATVEQLFVSRFRELLAAGEPAIHRRLGEEFGVTERRSQTKVSELRKRLGAVLVPQAPPGRRAQEDDDGEA